MASTMRNLARGISSSKPDEVEQKQEEPVKQPVVQAQPEPLSEPVVVPDIVADPLPVVNEQQAHETVESILPEPEVATETLETPDAAPPIEPTPESEQTQVEPPAEKKTKPKPPPKKPKAADQKKVNTPKVETEV